MKILVVLWLASVAVVVTARHKKEWQKVDVTKLRRERPQIFYTSNKPACSRGAGFYRDPQDCHQFIRCVDEFGTGRHFNVYLGRCEPGLVFDENVSACNWPELAAPCSNSPPRVQEGQKPLRPEQIPEDNAIYEGKNWDQSYPEQQQVIQGTQIADSDTQQQEIFAIKEIQAAQEPIYSEGKQQVEIQSPEEQLEQQILEENSKEPSIIQEEIYQNEAQDLDTQQQENVQVPSVEEQKFEVVQAFEPSSKNTNSQNVQQSEQVIYEEQNNQYDQIKEDSRPEEVSGGEFQQMLDQEIPQTPISQQAQEEEFSQESQSEWWVPESNPQQNPPEHTEQLPASVPSQQPIFCSKDGFYRHPENCSQFIRCVQIGGAAFAVHFFECPKQLVFDEKDNACIVSDIPECKFNIRKKRQAPNTNLKCKGEGFFRHPVDCRAFYRCVKTENGFETHQFSCPANLVFDEEYTTCNWPEKAPPCNSQAQYKPTKKPVKPQSSTTANRRTYSTKKPNNDFIDKSITQETYSKRRSTERPRSTTQSYETGAKCRSAGFFGDENDCTKFYKCVKKGNRYIRYDLSCPKNFAYDDMSQKCVAQRYATSCKRNKSPYPPKQDDEETTVAPETSSSSSSSSETGNDASSCEKEGYFRNPEDCNKFYRCVDFDGSGEEFVRYDFNCPEGLVFDEENSVCNWPDQSAPCDTRGSGGKDTNEDNGGIGSTTEGNENDEGGSEGGESEITTSSTSKPVESTSASTTDVNEETGGSDDQESNKESGSDGSDNDCTKEGFYRNPEDCNKFYRCVDFDGEGKEFVRYDFSCPEGLVFDETNSVCNWPSESEPCDTRSGGNNNEDNDKDGSESSSSSTPGTNGESSEDSRDSSESKKTTPTGNESTENSPDSSSSSESSKDDSISSTESSNESTSGSRGSNKENNGECSEEGFFRNPDDCNKFYRCVDQNGQFVKYDFTCPEGLVFDETNSVCNWPDQSAPCDGESSKGGQRTTSQGDGNGSESSESTTSSSRSTSTEKSEEITESATPSTTGSPQSTDGEDSKSTTERSSNTSPEGGESGSTSDTSGSKSGSNQGDCTEEGFFRNPEDCNKFYRCVDFNGDGEQFVRYDFDCPEGLVFDEVNSVCNWPDQSPKCEAKSGSESNRTTESGGESSTSQTESSTERAVDSTEQSTISSSYEPTQASTERSTQSSTEQSSTRGSSTSGDSSECGEAGFFRCKDDCNKFYRCVDDNGKFVRYDFKCPEGLIFDDKNKKCDFPSSTLTCEADASSTTTSSYESSTSTKSSTSSETSSKECTEEGYFRDPDDCRKYYRCIDEGDGTFTREDFLCAEDEVFDEEMRYCNRKDLAPPCDQSETPGSSTQSTASESVTTERSATTQASTESSTKSGNFECTEPGFFRCPEDCNKFYRCVEEENGNLVRYDFHCPDGLIFDEKNKKCDWPSSEVTCDTESSSPTSTTKSSTAGSPTSEGTTSSRGTASSSECTEEGFFRNPDDCSKYYRCIDEGDGTFTREDYACEEDEVFDEEMRYCNRKDLAPPCDGTSSTTQSSGSTKSQTSEEERGSSGGTTSSSTETTPTSSGTTSSSSEDGSRDSSDTTRGSSGSGECEEEGFHRDPNDCGKFYRCVDFKGDGQSFTRYDFDCPEGLVFDETNDVCNWPSSVPECESDSKSRGSTKSDSSSTKSSTEASSETSESSTTSTTSQEQTSTTAREQTSTTQREQTSTTQREQTSTTQREQTSTTVREQTSTTSHDSTTDNQGTSSSGSNEGSTSSETGTTSSGGTGSRGSGSSDNIECTEEGFFRHPEDCSKFYRCVDFAGTGESYVRYDFDCPEGLVFDEVNSVCNWPNQSPRCETGSRAGSPNNDTGSTDSSSTDSSSTSSSSQSTDNSRTTRQSESSTTSADQTTRSSSSTTSSSSEGEFRCEEEGFFKHPTDCKKYYECKHDEDTGELVKIDCECPDGQVWDNEGWYCNAEELSPPCESGSKSSSFKCTEEGFFRDPEDCTRYYRCNRTGPGENDFSSERYQCDDGLVFDEEGRYCNAPELSEPCDGSSSTSSGTTSSESSRGETNDGSTTDGSTDGSATDGSATGSTSSNGGYTTNDDSSRGTTSSGSSSNSNNCTSEGFFRNPEDCTKYYQCSRNEETGEFDRSDYSCSEGRIFDEVSNYCNEPELSEQPCDSDNNIESTTSRQTNTQSSSSDGGSSSGTTASAGTRKGENPECTQEGFFRHPDDCNKFYRCVDFAGTGESFVRYDFDCPEGLHFDEVNSVCNWPTMTPPCESSNRVFLSNRAV